MIVNKSVALFIVVILSLPCITTSKAVFDDDGAPTKIFADSLFDEIRGIKIDFTPPEIIQECGSYFNLDLTLTKERPLLSNIFSISVLIC